MITLRVQNRQEQVVKQAQRSTLKYLIKKTLSHNIQCSIIRNIVVKEGVTFNFTTDVHNLLIFP